MVTYVINTSENKTFDSTMLFELAGYNKIRWLNCALQDVKQCAEEIYEKQNMLVADKFRIAIIVDFYGFDKIRTPYGRRGIFGNDSGVDISIYMPYIEAFLLDRLIVYLEDRELFATDFEIYYVQNERSERYELFDNAKKQLKEVLSGDEEAAVDGSADEKALAEICDEKYTDVDREWVRMCVENNAVVKLTQLTELRDKNSVENDERIKAKSLNEGSFSGDAEEYKRAELYADYTEKGKLYPFVIRDEINVGEELKVVRIPAEDEKPRRKNKMKERESVLIDGKYKSFKVTELFLPDGTQVSSFDEAGKEVFVRIPDDIEITDRDMLSKCDKLYSSFKLYCSKNVSLTFRLDEYPYGLSAMTFSDFWIAFRRRMAVKTDIRRHYYLTTYGGGASRAALDTFSLALYLIRMYEREEEVTTEGTLEVLHLDSAILKDVLETAWSKVNTAKNIAKKNDLTYYSLDQESSDETGAEEKELSPKEAISRERANLPAEIVNSKLSAGELYDEIMAIATRNARDVEHKNRKEFDEVMGAYLRKRDETREADIEEEFQSMDASGFLKMTDQCPSKEEYEHAVDKKKKAISSVFEKALKAEYIGISYKEEKKAANEAYSDYKKAEACMKKSLLGDTVFLVLAVLSMLIPYIFLQLRSFTVGGLSAAVLGVYAAALFAGLFLISLAIHVLPLAKKMSRSKRRLQKYYIDCCAKDSYAFSAIRRRYEKDLISIEHSRYDIRQLKRLYTANIDKENNVAMHHEMLDRLIDCLSSILNNLDVEPIIDPVESVEEEFDISKPVRSRDNTVYQIFSIETIERMFPKKGVE